MEIDVTDFFRTARPADYSASQAEMGLSAGRVTWANALREAARAPLLKTKSEIDALRAWARDTGAWDDATIRGWTAEDCNALFIQMISGDMRELEEVCSDREGNIAWAAAREAAEAGQIQGNLYIGDVDGSAGFGRLFFYLGS